MILNHAIRRNRVELVRNILNTFKIYYPDNSIFRFNGNDEYPLTIAAKYNNPELVDIMININMYDKYEHFFVYMCRHGVLDKVTYSWDKVSGNAKEHGLVEALKYKHANIVGFILSKSNEFKPDHSYNMGFGDFASIFACEYVCKISDSVDFIKKFSFYGKFTSMASYACQYNNYNVARYLVDTYKAKIDFFTLYRYWDGSKSGDFWLRLNVAHDDDGDDGDDDDDDSIYLMLEGLAYNSKIDTYDIFVKRYFGEIVGDRYAAFAGNNNILNFLVSENLVLSDTHLLYGIEGGNVELVIRMINENPSYLGDNSILSLLASSSMFVNVYGLFSEEVKKIIHDRLLSSMGDGIEIKSEDNMLFIARNIFTLDEVASVSRLILKNNFYNVLAYLFKDCRLVSDKLHYDVYKIKKEEKIRITDFNRDEHSIVYTDYILQENGTINREEYVYNTGYEFWFRLHTAFIGWNGLVKLLDSGVKIISKESQKLEFNRVFVAYYFKKKNLPREIVKKIMSFISYDPGKQIDQINN